MSRSYLFRRPKEDDIGTDVVEAKPIDEKYAKRLGDSFKGTNFVRGSEKSQAQFYGENTVKKGTDDEDEPQPLSADERNKLEAKILKAELKGNSVSKNHRMRI